MQAGQAPALSRLFWRRPGSPVRGISLMAGSAFSSCTSSTDATHQCCFARLFAARRFSYKPYPCGRPLHAAIDAALAAKAPLDIEWSDDIDSVTI
jgi:2-methylcitrate dehydratase PrpD